MWKFDISIAEPTLSIVELLLGLVSQKGNARNLVALMNRRYCGLDSLSSKSSCIEIGNCCFKSATRFFQAVFAESDCILFLVNTRVVFFEPREPQN